MKRTNRSGCLGRRGPAHCLKLAAPGMRGRICGREGTRGPARAVPPTETERLQGATEKPQVSLRPRPPAGATPGNPPWSRQSRKGLKGPRRGRGSVPGRGALLWILMVSRFMAATRHLHAGSAPGAARDGREHKAPGSPGPGRGTAVRGRFRRRAS